MQARRPYPTPDIKEPHGDQKIRHNIQTRQLDECAVVHGRFSMFGLCGLVVWVDSFNVDVSGDVGFVLRFNENEGGGVGDAIN